MTQIPEDAVAALDEVRAVGGDELVASLLRTFLTYADEQMARAASAVTRGDTTEIARVAHALKSSARQLGANTLADACLRAEADAGALRETATATVLVAAMERELAAARDWMEGAAAAA